MKKMLMDMYAATPGVNYSGMNAEASRFTGRSRRDRQETIPLVLRSLSSLLGTQVDDRVQFYCNNLRPNPMPTKVCSQCREVKDLSEFQRRPDRPDGRKSACKACISLSLKQKRDADVEQARAKEAEERARHKERLRVYQAGYRARNREKINEVIRRSKDANPTKYLLFSARTRARQRGWEFSITEEDISIPDCCPVFGTPLKISGRGKRDDNSPSIDRIDNSKGYVPGNVVVISYRANMVKSIGTADEHDAIARWMREVFR
jgi:hypothetical protein